MWITNNPEAAAKLRSIDNAYESARRAARNLPLAEKIIALRSAKSTRDEAYKNMR
jgi:hypothetical protein